MYKNGETSKCISVNGALIKIPTKCSEPVGFTNPDDLEPALLARWKNGERGPELENHTLRPGDCLVMYNNGRNFNKILDEDPNWHTTPEGIKRTIEILYSYAKVGAKKKEPAIWNSDIGWAKSVDLTTTGGDLVTDNLWQKNFGKAVETIKKTIPLYFLVLRPDDVFVDGKKSKLPDFYLPLL